MKIIRPLDGNRQEADANRKEEGMAFDKSLFDQEVAANLRALRARKNVRQQDVALATGMDATTLSNYETGKGDYYGTDPRPVNLHWTPASADAYGVCEATVQFNVYERTGIFPPFRYEKVEDGPVVTVKFVNEYSGISAAQQTDLMPTSRYLLSGQQITVPRKGLIIVKYADGSTRKVMVK